MSFVQSAKLVKATGEPLRALYELDIALQNIPQDQHEVPSLSQSEVEEKDRVLAKAKLLRVRWMRESERFDSSTVLKDFSELSRTYSRYVFLSYRWLLLCKLVSLQYGECVLSRRAFPRRTIQ